MSATLMSCVRDNSPPLDVIDSTNCCSTSGPMSLPDCNLTAISTAATNQQQFTSAPASVPNVNEVSSGGGEFAGGTAINAEPKRRRFNPLRNLRRIFRRRTITSVSNTPLGINASNTLPHPLGTASEQNLRSATLSSTSSVVSASSPSSPLTNQQLEDHYLSQSLPKSKSYSISGSGEYHGAVCGTGGSGEGANSNNTSKSPRGDVFLKTVINDVNNHLQITKQQLSQQFRLQLDDELVQENEMDRTTTTTSSMYPHHQHHHQQVGTKGDVLFQPHHSVRQSLAVAVLPSATNRTLYADRQKLRIVGDSSLELDSSGNNSGSATTTVTTNINNTSGSSGFGSASGDQANDCVSNEISASQRSLSECRLVGSDYSHDAISHSHDSVFAESASASLFSKREYQAELSDVLRKRNRNHPDVSEEDLGLARSPASSQRRADHTAQSEKPIAASVSGQRSNSNQSEVSSLSLLSMKSSGDGDNILATFTANNSTNSTKDNLLQRSPSSSRSLAVRSLTHSSIASSGTSVCSETYRQSSSGSLGGEFNQPDDTDMLDAKCHRLSHAAAKHKMALRPAKKKVPSRQHRRTLEATIPEANEDKLKLTNTALLDILEHGTKAKTCSLPPSVNINMLDKHAKDTRNATTSALKSKANSTISSSNVEILNVKRTKTERMDKNDGGCNKLTVSTSANYSTSIINSATASLFGLRTLTAKSTALLGSSKESSTDPTTSKHELKKEKKGEVSKEVKLKEIDMPNNDVADTAESGFLRRLIQRNSKRTNTRPTPFYSSIKSNTDDITAVGLNKIVLKNESEAKSSLHISTSSLDLTKQNSEMNVAMFDKSRCASDSDEESNEQGCNDIKRETCLSSGITCSSTTTPSNSANNNITTKETALLPHKPKSGAAARQRYVPQDIDSLDRKTNNFQQSSIAISTTTSSEPSYTGSCTGNIFSKCSKQEVFQSANSNSTTSLYKSSEQHHHFEKKPKIVGLSAFQQKVSRSNDSVSGRLSIYGFSNSQSNNSLDAASYGLSFRDPQQKQRKAVEKSRSFRAYQKDSPYANTNAMQNNMPSLPDLTLNMRNPCCNATISAQGDRSTSLDFEVTQKWTVHSNTSTRTESTGNLTTNGCNFSRNIAVKSPATKLVSPSVSNTSTDDIDEQQEIKKILLSNPSPIINTLRRPTSTTSLVEKITGTSVCNMKSLTSEITLGEQKHLQHKVLQLRNSNTSIESSTSTDNLTTTNSNTTNSTAVPMRKKSKLTEPNVVDVNGRNSVEILAASTKDLDRKSAPAHVLQVYNKAQSSPPGTRRCTSMQDSSPNNNKYVIEERKLIDPSPSDVDGMPEFMRIQLNRVDPAYIAKSANVVLAKNVRETQTAPQQSYQQQQIEQLKVTCKNASERNSILEDPCLRRLSNESVEIIEKLSPTEIDKKKTIFEISQNNALPARSAIKKQQQPPLVLTPTTPTTPIEGEESALRAKPTSIASVDAAMIMSANKLSLQERKRLFFSEEKQKSYNRIEELRNERKKSISEEVFSKSFTKPEEKLETYEKAAAAPESVVILRKKSFCSTAATQSTLGGTTTTTNSNRNDPTPELIKVFARRSLKIKDEDICALPEKLHVSIGNGASSGSTNDAKRFLPHHPNIDSDKENQSASDEKLDQLPKLEAPIQAQIYVGGSGSGKVTNGINNRNSMADFRLKLALGSGAAHANDLSMNNNNNCSVSSSSNNNKPVGTHTVNNTTHTAKNITTNSSGGGGSNRVSNFLPPTKIAGFRALPIERNNSVSKIYPTTNASELVNNNNSNNKNLKTNHHMNQNSFIHYQQQKKSSTIISNERQSLNIDDNSISSNNRSSIAVTNPNSKTIERSATVSEFKGIHQRRAEWEQRAKEALK